MGVIRVMNIKTEVKREKVQWEKKVEGAGL